MYNIIQEFSLIQRGIRMPNADWVRGGAVDGGGQLVPEKCESC